MYFTPSTSFIRKARMASVMLTALLVLLVTAKPAVSAPDTTWSVTFSVNMSKAVKDHLFLPDSDDVYVVLDQGIQPLKLVAGPGSVYSGTLYNEIDSTTTYHYKFRINDSTWESVNRTFVPQPGMADVSVWWNDDPLNVTTFVVNMKYAVQYGLFNPATDSVSIIGTMNDWLGSPRMARIDTTLTYSLDYVLDPGSVHQYKFRINTGDTAAQHLELLYKPNRIIRIPDTLLEASSDFNNFNPARKLMTFRCNMTYYLKTHRFTTGDYLDVAGNFNGNGADDVLFDTDGDSIYTLGKYFDTAWIHQGPLSFKYRINGSWSSAELEGKAFREYAIHDTVNQNPNIYTGWYNNVDPTIPTPPWVYDVAIQGDLIHKKIISGIYSYEDINSIPEDSSSYKWYRSFDAAGDSLVAIDSAWNITYTIDTLDIGKWLVFEVTPRAAWGDSAVGKTVRVISASSIGGVGIGEHPALISVVYPNPATDQITVETSKEIELLELFTMAGRKVLAAEGLNTRAVRLQVSQLPRGVYLLKATAGSRESGTATVIKY